MSGYHTNIVQIVNNMFCEFTQIDWDIYECQNCGTRITLSTGNDPPIFPCKKTFIKENIEMPSIGSKVLNFAKSTVDHIVNGSPSCTAEQIEQRYSICTACEFLQNHTCSKCGCPISRTKQFISKLAWADQECPIGKWKKEI